MASSELADDDDQSARRRSKERGMGALAGRVGIVTGASGGIGLAAAQAMVAEGAAVVIADIQDERGEQAADGLRRGGAKARYVHVDVTSEDDVSQMIETTLSSFGRLDFAFNNAGIEGAQAPLADGTPEDWWRVLDVNLGGVWRCMRAEIPVMLAAGGGSIVNCASVAGLVGFAGIAPYVASKHGIVGITKTAALDYATAGIRVNAVCPGVIQTQMVERFTHGDPRVEAALAAAEPIGRLGEPIEVGAAVAWLCSDAASFVTGVAMPVDGGFVAQ
jgi:NAD(P)-dependent dehydrogenase (short-subunit alcohol dehydrogenase family)